jgi:hypothetical protein
MSDVPKRIRFNYERGMVSGDASTSAAAGDGFLLIPSLDPVIDLELDAEGVRTSTNGDGGALKVPKQRDKLPELQLAAPADSPFGSSLDWAYRCYKVLRPTNDEVFRDYLYLFNVLVALEWQPNQQYLQQLTMAFQRASDFLFDVTDGWMAFGQVVFGGAELMESADIQIMASTRLHPRSWVGAMHPHDQYSEDQKYIPIRLGRGLWSDNRHGIIPWDEPEAYRIIVHEWGHHALKLTDEYLETRQLLLSADAGLSRPGGHALIPAPPTTVVMLKVATTTDSVMATTEGTSELVSKQWAKVCQLYPRVRERQDAEVRAGPGGFPAPLPFVRSDQLPEIAPSKRLAEYALPPWRTIDVTLNRLALPDDIELDHCWVYLLKGMRAGVMEKAQLIAQGTLEFRSQVYPFPLLGAEPGDSVILIAEQRDCPPVVLRGELADSGELHWSNATPPAFPAIDVIPEPVVPNAPRASVCVRLHQLGELEPDDLPEQVCLFPLGQPEDYTVRPLDGAYDSGWISAPHDLPTLDGHVLVRWSGDRFLISSFSQGGDGPESGHPFPANPMNAGSADGQALLFMYKDDPDDHAPRDIKVVTGVARGLVGAPEGGHERGAAFSIASNQPLPRRFNPTLIMYYDPSSEAEQAQLSAGDVRICRWSGDAGWVALPTYVPPGFRFVVAPLDKAAGAALIDPLAQGPRVEYFKVCWVPRAAAF